MAVIAKQRYKLDIAPKGGWVIVYASQHDNGAREIEFAITNQGNAFSIPASINVSVQGIKSNGSYFSHSCSYSGNVVTMALADDMTDVVGKAVCVLKFTNSSNQKLASAKFILNVDSDSSSEGVIIDTEAEEIFNQMLNDIRAQAASISVDIAELQSMVGTPLVASTASAMTDHNKIYVYTGSQSGYTNGNWYYWNGSAWTSGGVYNSTAFETDKTLSVENMAADAWEVGKFKSSAYFSEKGLSDVLSKVVPDVVPLLEIGDMTINNSGWTYNNGTARAKQRVRTVKGYSIPLKRGDKIGLTDYTDARYYLGWKLSDNTYGSHGWYTADTTIAYDGDYVILLAHVTEVDQTDVAELGALLFVKKSGGEYNPLSVVQRSSGGNILKTTTWVDGYITSSGIHAPTTQLEITTDFINIDDTTEYKFRLSHVRYTGSVENEPWIGIATYDINRTYLRRPTVSTPINVDNDKEYFEYTLVPNSGEKYIRISFRSFGSYSAELVAVNDGVVWYGYDVAEPKDLQNGRYLTMKGVNHRGWGECPENTLIAYKQSAIHGFNYVETDVRYTSDGVPVLLHDASINRTARNADGTTISTTVNIVDITYAQSQEYDFGIYKGSAFAGTKIPRFEDFILLCKRLALHPYIELKTGMTNAQIINLVDIVRNYGMLDSVTWIAYATGWFNLISTRHARSRIGVLMTSVTQATIDAAKAYRTGENSVFIDTSDYGSSAVALIKANEIPMEAWTIDEDADIIALDHYITGVTSNLKIAGKVVYDNLLN